MDAHENARTTPHGRLLIVARLAAGWSPGLKHKRTRPDTPRTNGKAQRFIQTSLREWAYAMPSWLCHYNSLRPHSARGGKPPITRLARNNLLGNDS